VLTTQADVDLIINCSSINYTLFVAYNSTIEGVITLPNLVTLWSLYVDGDTPATGFSFPQLTTITHGIGLFSNNIKSLDFPLLSDIGGFANFDSPALQTWSGTDSLRSIDHLELDAHNISSLSFGNLSSALSLSVNFSAPGGSLYLNGTASPAVLVIGSDNTTFYSDLQYLSTTIVKGCNNITINAVSASSIEISSNPDLIGFHFENLVSLGPVNLTTQAYVGGRLEYQDALLIEDNPLMDGFRFPFLDTIQGSLQITNNENLGTIVAFAYLHNVTGDITVTGNTD
jgi:hypothetical protein